MHLLRMARLWSYCAFAGNTAECRNRWHGEPAYPRMRGEHALAASRILAMVGLSPHAQGTPQCIPCVIPLERLIPACAGNTIALLLLGSRCSAYPRMRGEQNGIAAAVGYDYGLSPHARGTLRRAPTWGLFDRLIPACAGNTVSHRASFRCPAAYPRMRGEHSLCSLLRWASIGLSPHARGTLCSPKSFLFDDRLIPACAGNTGSSPAVSTCTPAYPRMRGEHAMKSLIRAAHDGLSPHARGTRLPYPLA